VHDKPAVEVIGYQASDSVSANLQVYKVDNPNAPVVVCLPAMGVRGSYYADFAQHLCKAGFHVAVADLRGIDSSSVRASRECDFGYAEILERDLPALTACVRQRFPASSQYFLGHSLGGQLWALYLSANPVAAEGLILIASCNVHYLGWHWPTSWYVLGMALVMRSLGFALGYVPGEKLGFAGTEARTVVRDWSHNCMTGRYEVANSQIDYETALQRLPRPILAISFETDIYAPPNSVDNLLRKFRSSRVESRRFTKDHPGMEKVTHFNWAKKPQVVVDTISEWISARQSLPER
jgi:predicted alpha/beta hydrolase